MTESSDISTSHIIINRPNPTDIDDKKKSLQPALIINNGEKTPKKRGTFSLLKAALFMMRRRPHKKQKKKSPETLDPHQQVASTGNWTKLVGSMRPMHLQENIESPPSSFPPSSPSPTVQSLEDVAPRPSSSSSSSPSSVSGGTMSQYASANDLQELDVVDEDDTEEDPDEVFDAITGDDMIDSKAEQFIAQFYHQMKLQNNDSVYDR